MINRIISFIRKYRFEKHLLELKQHGLKIGENTHILDGAFLDPSHCFLISIGSNCTLAPNVRIIAHDASTKKTLGATKIAKVTIHDNCFLGDSVIVLPGVSIGPHAIIGAGSVVNRTIPPNSVAAGNPAQVIDDLDTFLDKHRKNLASFKLFEEERYNIKHISPDDKLAMLRYLEENMMGFMIGTKIRIKNASQKR